LGAYNDAQGGWHPTELYHVAGANYYAMNPANGAIYYSAAEANNAAGAHVVIETQASGALMEPEVDIVSDTIEAVTDPRIYELGPGNEVQPVPPTRDDPTIDPQTLVLGNYASDPVYLAAVTAIARAETAGNFYALVGEPEFYNTYYNLKNQIAALDGGSEWNVERREMIAAYTATLRSFGYTYPTETGGNDDRPIDYPDGESPDDLAYISATGFVTNLYRTLLNREPDDAGLNFYVSGIVNSTDPNVRNVVRQEFLDSDEFYQIHGGAGGDAIDSGGGGTGGGTGDDTDTGTGDDVVITPDPDGSTGTGFLQSIMDYVSGVDTWILVAGGVGAAYALGFFGDDKKKRK
jgi:hypothetical protein